MKRTTIANEGLQENIEKLVALQIAREKADLISLENEESRKQELKAWLEAQAEAIVDEMTVNFDHKSLLKFLYYAVAQILHRTYHQGVHVDHAEVERLRAKAQELEKKRQSIIFLPCHKSHVDYMSITFICFRVGISLPTVIAGNNLNFAVIGPMLRRAGALWIRRNFGDDKLYNYTMQAYIEMLLSNGYNFECFIEGTRSRTGKLLPPKFGILKFILDGLLSGRVEDSWMVPVSTQYDKVAEGESYVTELLGSEKKKENFFAFLDARKIMSLQMGRVDVRFHEGWSLREYVVGQVNKELVRNVVQCELNLNKIDAKLVTPEIKTKLLRALGYRILADINATSVVMPTSLVGCMLLTLRGRGIGQQDLTRRVTWLILQIQAKGGKVGNFNQPSVEALVSNALKVLGPDLVGEVNRNLLETTYFSKDAFKLSYYRNQVIHLFVNEAIVCAAIYFKFQKLHETSTQISYLELMKQVQFLSKLLSGEFVFEPEGIQANLEQTLEGLVSDQVLTVTGTGDERLINISDVEIEHGKEIFEFYCFLVWPFLDGFWLTLVSLFALTPTLGTDPGKLVWVETKEFVQQSQVLGKTLYHQGIIVYYEAVNKEMLANAVEHYASEGIILKRQIKGTPQPVLSLAPSWTPERYNDIAVATQHDGSVGDIVAHGALYDLCEKIAELRRLIRVRRDTPTLSTRVLSMVSGMADLFKKKWVLGVDEDTQAPLSVLERAFGETAKI